MNKFIRNALIITSIAIFALYVIVGGEVLFRVIFLSNHMGHSLYDYLPFCMLSLAWGFLLAAFKINRLGKVMMVVSALSILAIFLLDYFNLLVEYEEWTRRGMPEKFHVAH